MVNYENAKIYKIEPVIEHDECDIYIGSTTKQYLSQRMDTHRSSYYYFKSGKNKGSITKSFDLFDKFGLDNCEIYLLEAYPCESKDELRAREGHYIRTLKNVNKNIAGRSLKEYQQTEESKAKVKAYQQTEENKAKVKPYHQTEKVKTYKKAYREAHKDQTKERNAEYRLQNREKLNMLHLEKVKCDCGHEYYKYKFKQHCATKIHKRFIDLENVIDV